LNSTDIMRTNPQILVAGLLLAVLDSCFGQPLITTQPQTQTVAVGSNATFTVEANGTSFLPYQWQKYVAEFTDLPARTNATLLLTNVQTSDAGDYRVVVTDATGTTNSDVASLVVVVPPGIMLITNNNPLVGVGASLKMQGCVTGTTPFIQWFQNGLPLTGKTGSVLALANVQTNNNGLYTVFATNYVGSVTSSPVSLEVSPAPVIAYAASLQHKAVFAGTAASFVVTSFGDQPQSVQWRFDGRELLSKTNKTLNFTAVGPADEGDYTVVLTNASGAVTSAPARLYVLPPSTELLRGNFTNANLQALSYFYWVPTNYAPTHSYWLSCSLHGMGDDVSTFPTTTALNWPGRLVGASYKQQAKDPGILVFPTRWWGGEDWDTRYLQLISGLLDSMISQFNIDTNRVVVGGGSQGVHGVWDLLAMKPGFFAGAWFLSGSAGDAPTEAIKDVPTWVSCAANDGMVGVSHSRIMVAELRQIGGHPIYTEYTTGDHVGGIAQAICTPAAVDWFLAQDRGRASTNEPLLSITEPTQAPTYATCADTLDLAGSAGALDQAVQRVVWSNTANHATGFAFCGNAWRANAIPLLANKTNLIIVTAATTSWAPAYGGETTFNNTLAVIQSPIRATLAMQGSQAILNWSGGGPPFAVQRATDLTAGDWVNVLTNALPPLPLALDGQAGFYRILGR